MSKPWEQEWRVESGYMPSVNSSAADCVGGIVAEVVVNPKSAKTGDEVRGARLEAAQFLSAAPDMARELVSALRSKSDLVKTPEGQRMRLWLTVEQVQAMAAAVKKAGVPL